MAARARRRRVQIRPIPVGTEPPYDGVMLYSDVDAVRAGKPWSIGGVMYGLQESTDDEGRPIYERRAPLIVKEGVPMEIRRCPYPDARLDRSMNVSALAQITRHLDAVLDDIRGFRASLPDTQMTWGDAYAVVVDQLVQAALFRLRHPDSVARIPTLASVAYKLAVGFSTPLREMLVLQARGEAREVTREALLSWVDERSLLVGAREACASPVNLLVRATDAFLGQPLPAVAPAEPVRVRIARPLAQQVQLGIAFNLFDEALEWQLLSGQHAAGRLSPRTQFLERMLAERFEALTERDPLQALGALPGGLRPVLVERLRASFAEPNRDGSVGPAAVVIAKLLNEGVGAVAIPAGGAAAFARAFAEYLRVYCAVIDTLFALECEARTAAGLAGPTEFNPHPTALPRPRALAWFEMACGYRLRCDPRPGRVLSLRSTEVEVPLVV